jgi:opacity protein-like surface antigen
MLRRSLFALAMLAVLPAAAAAASFTAFGPQLGFSSGPNQFVFGGHLQWGDIAPQLDFVPGIDLGFGDHKTVVSVNGDFHYRLDTKSQWQPYLGGGVGIHFFSFDNVAPGVDKTDTRAGGHFIAGADVETKSHSRFFAELKLGFADSPDFKAMVGWSFKPR